MTYDPKIHHRRSIRLKGYDYSQEGAYFLTICTYRKEMLFGTIVNEEMRLNDTGEQALQCWNAIPGHFPNVELDAFVIMPNHIHGIIVIVGANNHSPINPGDISVGAKNFSPLQSNTHPAGTSQTVGSIVRGFKIGLTKWIRNPDDNDLYGRKIFCPYVYGPKMSGPVWHRNFYEHIIRDEPELFRIRKYIVENPAKWYWDNLNPDAGAGGVRESDAAYGMEAWMV